MTDDEKNAEIDAEYTRALRELIAKHPWVKLSATLLDTNTSSAQRARAEAIEIEKITTVTPEPSRPVTPDPPPAAVVEMTQPPASGPAVIHLPHLVTSPIAYPFVIRSPVTSSSGKQSVIGQDFETGEAVTVGDTERCGGFYVLGQPRTGKSTLLISMALEDIKHGHGLLFIDPHTEAIDTILARLPKERLKDVIYLDPTKTDRSFGINLLHCKDKENRGRNAHC